MRQVLTALLFLTIGSLHGQNPLSQIEGFLEVYPATDTTSLYIGKRAGQQIDVFDQLYNVFLGSRAGEANTTGNENVFVGRNAGLSNKNGCDNVFVGNEAGEENESGENNVFIGESAGQENQVGSNGVFIGFGAGEDSKGDNNTLVGYEAGENIDSTMHNTCLGARAGNELAGDFNTYIGSNAGKDASQGDYNVVVGYKAGDQTYGSFNCFLGSFAGNKTDGNQNVFVGHSSGKENSSGRSNTFLGYHSGLNNDDGNFNTLLGNDAGLDNETGSSNVFVGSGSGKANVGGGSQVYLGNGAGSSSKEGSNSVCLGTAAGLFDSSIQSSVYVGHNAGALSFNNQVARTGNVFLGNFAGYNHTGSNKLFISNSSVDFTEALVYGEFNNNILRVNADLHIAANASTGNSRVLMKGVGGVLNEVIRYDGDENDVLMGSVSGAGGKFFLRSNGQTQMAIIENGNVGIGTNNPTADLHVNGIVKIETLPPLPSTSDLRYTSDGIIARSSSDRRLKTDIQTLKGSLDRVLRLRGVSYIWKDDRKTGVQIGMIAQEVKEVVPEIVNQGEEGFYSIDYTETVGLLVEAIKDQQKIINKLTKTNQDIEAIADLQSDRIAKLEILVSSMIDTDSVEVEE